MFCSLNEERRKNLTNLQIETKQNQQRIEKKIDEMN